MSGISVRQCSETKKGPELALVLTRRVNTRIPAGYTITYGTDINEAGIIVGQADIQTGPNQYQRNRAVMLVPLKIKEVISDQIRGNEANKLPTGKAYHGDANNPMLMAATEGNTANIAVKIVAPDLMLSKILVAVRKVQADGNGQILGSTSALQAPGKTLVQFNAEPFHASNAGDTSNLYEVVAGYDTNGDGVLAKNEIGAVFSATDGNSDPPHDKFRVVTKDFYDRCETTLEGVSNYLPTGYAENFLNSFLTGSAIPGAVAVDHNLTSSAENLSHPLGAVWSTPANSATVVLNNFGVDTAVSVSAAQSNAVSNIIDATLMYQKAEIVTYFVLHPGEADHDFTFDCLPTATSVNLVNTEGGTSPLGLTFGKVTLHGSFLARCSRVGIITEEHKVLVQNVTVTGGFDDLYDFSYYGAPLSLLGITFQFPLNAASVQAGYATLATSVPAGRVYQVHVDFHAPLSWNKFYTATAP